MEHWTSHVARLGAELGPTPPDDLLPTPVTVLARVAVERADEDTGRAPDADVAAAVGALHRLLGRTPRPWCGPALDAALVGLDPTWAPLQAVRLAAAVAAGLLAGHLPPGRPWALHIEEPVGAAGPALGPVFDLLGGLLDGWDPTVAPPTVTTNVGSLRRAGAGYQRGGERLRTVPDLWVELDPWTLAGGTEHVPTSPRDAPTVVVRPAPAGAADPGPSPPSGLPPNPGPALTAAARWCFPAAAGEELDRQRAHIEHLLGRSGPPTSDAPGPRSGRPGSSPDFPAGGAWRREEADLLVAAQPDQPAAWCVRALVEAQHPAGSRPRHIRLVEAAARTGRAAGELRQHAGDLRGTGQSGWALDVWTVADAALEADLTEDVLCEPAACHAGELALSLAARAEAAAIRCRVVVSGQTDG